MDILGNANYYITRIIRTLSIMEEKLISKGYNEEVSEYIHFTRAIRSDITSYFLPSIGALKQILKHLSLSVNVSEDPIKEMIVMRLDAFSRCMSNCFNHLFNTLESFSCLSNMTEIQWNILFEKVYDELLDAEKHIKVVVNIIRQNYPEMIE